LVLVPGFFFGTTPSCYCPIQLGISIFSFFYGAEYGFSLSFFSPQHNLVVFCAGIGSILAALFFFLVSSSWWLSRSHNLRVGSKFQFSGVRKFWTCPEICPWWDYLVCGGAFWCHLFLLG